MDLPTCPSCGQSVLDDEPVSCPFCGAAMDGSSGPTKDPAPPLRNQKADKPETPSEPQEETADAPKRKKTRPKKDEDPFEITASPQARRAIACAPKRTKSRPMPVKCPMCDTKGYVPRSAAGKEVKCWNKECMVPLFTAPGPENTRKPSTDSSISDQAEQQQEKLTTEAKPGNPMLKYGVIGAVSLVAVLGVKMYLDQEPDLDQFNKPITITPAPGDNLPEDSPTSSGNTEPREQVVSEVEAARVTIARLADKIVDAARISTNRDKALCRRYSADAFLRIDQTDRAEQEFAQLMVVSQQRNRDDAYYRIVPRARIYWSAVADNDTSLSDEIFEKIAEDAASLPDAGLLGIEATIKWAAILVQRGKVSDAQTAVARLAVDNTVRGQRDQLLYAVWSAVTNSAAAFGLHSDTPLILLSAERPEVIAVGLELALQSQWQAAAAWAQATENIYIRSAVFAQVARRMLASGASESAAQVLTDAGNPAEVQQRLMAVLSRRNVDELQVAANAILPTEPPAQRPMFSIQEILNYSVGDDAAAVQKTRLYIDLACSAALLDAHDTTTSAIIAAHRALGAQLPTTEAVRQASLQLDQSQSDIEARIRQALGRPDSDDVTKEFRNYRRGLDRLASAVERRRLLLIVLLGQVVKIDAGKGLTMAMEQDEALRNQLTLDPLCQLLSAVAVLAGGEIPLLADATQVRIAKGKRTQDQAEERLAVSWQQLMADVRQEYDKTLFDTLDTQLVLPGLRSCVRLRIVESQAAGGNLSILDAATEIANASDQEQSLNSAAFWLTRNGQAEAVENWLGGKTRLTPSATAQVLAGIVQGLPLEEPPAVSVDEEPADDE